MSWSEPLQSANWNLIGGIGLGAYLLGCFAAGYYLVRIRTGRDVRDSGSGSVGARNVGRVLGKAGFLFTALFDFSKGAFVVWAARNFTVDEHLVALAMISVVAGHIWPVQLQFRGGKGMATALGALLVFDPRLALAFAGVFLCVFALLRHTAVPGTFALCCLPLFSFFRGDDAPAVSFLTVLAALILLAHRKNVVEEFHHLARRFVHSKTDHTQL